MSNEAKAVCTSQLAAFFAQGHRAVTAAAPLGAPHSFQQLTIISPSSRNQITQTLLFIKKKDCPQTWVKRPMITRHCVMGFLSASPPRAYV